MAAVYLLEFSLIFINTVPWFDVIGDVENDYDVEEWVMFDFAFIHTNVKSFQVLIGVIYKGHP